VLIVNPNAGRLSETVREDVIGSLRSRFRIEAFSTTARDTGIAIAADAAESGANLVIAFGGDGHVNEVANGLAGTSSTLAIIPGGTMNVFARALGIPLDPFAAIDHLEEQLDRAPRRVPLGQVDDRYFTFSAGCGFDAEAAQRVERYVPAKRRFGEAFFFWSAARVLVGSYRHRNPSMTLSGSFGELDVSMAIVCNAGPYAYLGPISIDVAPDVRLEGGIDVFALKRMRIESLPVYTWRVLVSRDIVHHDDVFYASDLEKLELTSERPFSRHVDGEPLIPAKSARFAIVPDILTVRA
jgi:diacylglycerol kinase family enzyme